MALAYARTGRGDPLVLVHGTGSQRQMWRPVLDRLAAERDVIAPDLPGHGESAALSERAVTPERYADVIEELLDDLGLGRAHVAGSSLGGGIAVVLGARGRALSVTALSPIGFWTPKEADFCRRSIGFAAAAARALEPVAPLILGNPVGRTLTSAQLVGRPWRMSAQESLGATRNLGRSPGLRAAMDGYRRWRFVPDGPLPCPVTIAWAQHDRLLLPRQAERARRALPTARQLILRGCGHVPTWDDPEQVARVLLEGSSGGAAASAA
jgi:pimeloyl-ACP methyl ester carboxylesterase